MSSVNVGYYGRCNSARSCWHKHYNCTVDVILGFRTNHAKNYENRFKFVKDMTKIP